MKQRTLLVPAVALALTAVLVPAAVRGSDHADPLFAGRLEPGLTGLFVFPDGDRMVVILATHRGLTAPPPYELARYEYAVHMDLHSRVTYSDAADRTQYGGTVVDPSGISPDVTLRFRFDDEANLVEHSFEGLRSDAGVRMWGGVRDDPFILPTFFGTNVVAMVTSIPFSAFPDGQQDWLAWGTSSEDGDQVDHVGRSSRTQLGRFDFLNTLPPSEHVPAIRRAHDKQERITKLLTRIFPPGGGQYDRLFGIRHYDFEPDVLIFTTRLPPGYPNGRQLPDDVALLTCLAGDCVLLETSITASDAWPRETTNDKDFSPEFPYLAEPWPPKAEEVATAGGCLGLVITVTVLLLLAVIVAFVLLVRCCRKSRRPAAPA